MSELLSLPPLLLWSIVSVLAACIVLAVMWERVKWWAMNTWYSFPLIGRIARASVSDQKLCSDYKNFIRIRSREDYDEKVTYLSKAGDTGRRGTPVFIWLLTIALVFVEAMGFSYVLAGYTIPGASENTQQLGALGIAFIVSVLLVGMTHFAGHELYSNSKIRMARRSWIDKGRTGDLFSRDMPLSKPQSLDDDQPYYTQLVNRNKHGAHTSYWITIATTVLVLVVAIGSTYVRGKVLDKQLHDDVSAAPTLQLGNAVPSMNLNVLELPAADQAQVEESKDKVLKDGKTIEGDAGWGTFIVLAFIFVFLQILGVLFGYKWGFAGAQSAEAFKAIGSGRYSSYEDVRDFYREIADIAQAKLEGLQNSRKNSASRSSTSADRSETLTFAQFMEAERAKESRDRVNETIHAGHRQAMQHSSSQAVQTPPAQQQAVSPDRGLTASQVSANTESAEDELQRLEQEVARHKQARLEAQQRADAEAARLEAQQRADAEAARVAETVLAAPKESAQEELARLEQELEAKRKQAKIEAVKRELQALENGEKA